MGERDDGHGPYVPTGDAILRHISRYKKKPSLTLDMARELLAARAELATVRRQLDELERVNSRIEGDNEDLHKELEPVRRCDTWLDAHRETHMVIGSAFREDEDQGGGFLVEVNSPTEMASYQAPTLLAAVAAALDSVES